MITIKNIIIAIGIILIIILFMYIWIRIDMNNSPTRDNRCRGGHDF